MKAKGWCGTGKNMSALQSAILSSPRIARWRTRPLPAIVVGIPNHGTLRIGDTLTEGEDLTFVGVPLIRAPKSSRPRPG